ncbi:MAG: amidohydrolase family protein, partial [Burkholderiales bacterium]|nr:amidohydrolase family protein [Burkholderiales bacterium]
GLAAVSVEAETIGLMRIVELVRATGARVHLARLSCARSVELVREAKAGGLAVTCDVAAHHVHMTEVDIGYFDSQCRVVPPFRAQRDRDALRAGLVDGTVDAICSDHAPVDEDDKALPFGEAEPGVSAVELLLPLTLKWAGEAGIDLATALKRITCGAADALAMPYGRMVVGGPADLALLDLDSYWKVAPDALVSQGKNTPFAGYELRGRVVTTLVAGGVVHGE